MSDGRTTIRQRLDLAKHVLSVEGDVSYRDALALHHQSVGILEHLTKAAGQPLGRMRSASTMLTAMWRLYRAEYDAKGVLVDMGGPRTGVSVHFLEWVEERLPGEEQPGNLLGLVRHALARWRKANPDVVPEVVGAGYCTV